STVGLPEAGRRQFPAPTGHVFDGPAAALDQPFVPGGVRGGAVGGRALPFGVAGAGFAAAAARSPALAVMRAVAGASAARALPSGVGGVATAVAVAAEVGLDRRRQFHEVA